MRIIFSILIWTFWAICIVAFFVTLCAVRILTFPFDKYHLIPDKMVHGVTRLMLGVNPRWNWEVRGADTSKISDPTIVVANHQSFMDVMLLNRLPWTMKWVVWRPLFYIPFLGWLMYLTGQIGIKQQSVQALLKLEKLVDPIKNGIPAMIFPEGERTLDGDIEKFRGGAFILAEHHNFNILPVVLKGGFDALPRGHAVMSLDEDIVVSVLDPVSTDDYESVDEMKESVRGEMIKELRKIRRESESSA